MVLMEDKISPAVGARSFPFIAVAVTLNLRAAFCNDYVTGYDFT